MPQREPAPIHEIHRLRLTLREVEPPVWRLLEVPSRTTLLKLHGFFQVAMDWFDYHLHEGSPASRTDRPTPTSQTTRWTNAGAA